MEYYSVLKKKEVQSHATALLKLGDIRVSEIGESWKDKYSFVSYELSKVVKLIETASRMIIAKVWGNGNGKLFNGERVLIVIYCTTMWIYLILLKWPLINAQNDKPWVEWVFFNHTYF